MKHTLKKIMISLGMLAVIPAAHADLHLSEYKRDRNSDNVSIRMRSIYEGFSYANLSLEENKQARLFCPPGALKVNYSHLSAILDKQIFIYETVMKDKGGLDYNLTVAPILLIALKKEFPCTTK